jgi:MoxR-like ATPase
MEPWSAVFEQQLERVRLRAIRAAVRAERPAELPAAEARLADLERDLAADADRGLAARFGLAPDDVDLLWAVVAATADPLLSVHLARLGPRAGRGGLSLAQYAALADLDGRRARALAARLAGAHPLLAHRLIEPLDGRLLTAEAAFVAAPRVVAFLGGDDAIDPALVQAGGPIELPVTPVLDAAAEAVVARLRQLVADGAPGAIVLQGRRGVGRRTLARAALDRPVLALDLDRLPRAALALGDALAALGRECRLARAAPLIAGVDDLAGPDAEVVARRREVVRFVDAWPGPVLLTASGPSLQLETSRPVHRVEVPLPAPRTRAALWRAALGADLPADAPGEMIERAAARFHIGPAGILAAAAGARAAAATRGDAITAADLAAGVRSTVEERLHGLARRHTTRLGWDDVVLPDDTREQIDLFVARVRHSFQVLERWGFARHLPGSGVAALFSGPPGTGKTMVASLIAQALGLELYRVDLSQIVSKWIGETEKQLELVFEAAETGHAVLLFDEADSLFAKRTEVKGATERYANLEVNFLLQRIESFSGVAILTTNMDGSIDPAFRRRLAAHIRFPHPEEDERLALWQRLLPRDAPREDDIDFEALAHDFPAFAGAQIRNALTTAAFLAAAAGTPLTQVLLRRAAIEESQAMGRVVKSERGL